MQHSDTLESLADRRGSKSLRCYLPPAAPTCAMPQRPGAVPQRPGAVPQRPGAVPQLTGAVPQRPSAMPYRLRLLGCNEPRGYYKCSPSGTLGTGNHLPTSAPGLRPPLPTSAPELRRSEQYVMADGLVGQCALSGQPMNVEFAWEHGL